MKNLYLKSLSLTLGILILFSSTLNAQDETAAAQPVNGDDPCWGLMFQWQRSFTLGKQLIDRINYNLTDDEKVTGFGGYFYPGPRSGIGIIGSVGISNDESENTSGKDEYSATEIGIKLSYDIYPGGRDKRLFWSFGPWFSYVSFNDENTFTPTTGDGTKSEFSTSRLGFGANVSAYVQFWEALALYFYAGYNLGAFITPSGTLKNTSGGQTIETEGPSSFHFQDCGGFVGVKFDLQ